MLVIVTYHRGYDSGFLHSDMRDTARKMNEVHGRFLSRNAHCLELLHGGIAEIQ